MRRESSQWVVCVLLLALLTAAPQLQTPAPGAANAPSLDERLLTAARTGDAAAAADLLAKGADVNAKTEYLITPLMFAADSANTALVKLLLDHGANPNAKDLEYGKTPLYLVSFSGSDTTKRKERLEIIRLLLEKGATGGEALERLVEEGYYAAAQTIVSRGGVDPVYLNLTLRAAKRAKQGTLSEVLVKAGAKDPGPGDSPRAPDRLRRLSGVYRNQAGEQLTLRFDEELLLLERPGKPLIELVTPSRNVSYHRSSDNKVVITFAAGPMPPKGLTLDEGGRGEAFVRVGEAAPPTRTSAMPPRTARETISPVPASTNLSGQWPSFRGPNGSGVADGAHPPTVWDASKGLNIKWKTPIPGFAHSSPIVWGDRIFVTTAVPLSGAQVKFLHGEDVADIGSSRQARDDLHSWRIYALDKQTGKILWQRVAHEGVPQNGRHVMQSPADSTPVTDGTHLVAWFGSEGVYCYDVDGTLLWKRELGRMGTGMYQYPDYEWVTSSSPIIYKNLVILQVDQLDSSKSFITAVDLKTGKDVWRTARDERASWTTPIVYEGPTGAELVTSAGEFARGYDPNTGKELWRFSKHSIFPTPMPLAGRDLIFITSGGGVTIQPIYALRPGAKGDITLADGETSSESIVWSKRRGGPYIPTPVLYGDLLYVVSNNGVLAAYKADTGERLYQERLPPGTYTASVVAADGHVYCANEDGDVSVVKAGPVFEHVAVNKLEEVIMASPAISPGMILFRTPNQIVAVADSKR